MVWSRSFEPDRIQLRELFKYSLMQSDIVLIEQGCIQRLSSELLMHPFTVIQSLSTHFLLQKQYKNIIKYAITLEFKQLQNASQFQTSNLLNISCMIVILQIVIFYLGDISSYKLQVMKLSRSINSQMNQLRANSQHCSISINYHRIINKQQELIQSLNQQILLLKSYITINKTITPSDTFCSQNSTISSISSADCSINKVLEESVSINFKNYQKTMRDIADLLELKDLKDLDDPIILQNIKKLKDISVKKQQPIFVERIKEIKVPITVEKIIQKEVEKIVQKIVYVEKAPQRIFYKEKKIEKNIPIYQQEQRQPNLNKTYSQKSLANKTLDSSFYRQDKYQEYQDKVKYDQYKKNDTSNLVKRRGEQSSKYYPYRNNYN